MALDDPTIKRLREAGIRGPEDIKTLSDASIAYGFLSSNLPDDISVINDMESDIRQDIIEAEDNERITSVRSSNLLDAINEATSILRDEIVGIQARDMVKEQKRERARQSGIPPEDVGLLPGGMQEDLGVMPGQQFQQQLLQFIQQQFDSESELRQQTNFDSFQDAAEKIMALILDQLGFGRGGGGATPRQ